MNENMITTGELASRWKIPKQRIWVWLSEGAPLPKSFKLGNVRLFKLQDVITFEEEHTEETSIN